MGRWDNEPFALIYLGAAVAALAARMEPAEAAKFTAPVVPKLLKAMGRTNDPTDLSRLGGAVAALVAQMAVADAAKLSATAASKVLEAMSWTNHPKLQGSLSTTFGALAKQIIPQDLANLLSERKFSPSTTEAILRQLEPLAGKRFESIDDAVKWLRSADAWPNAPAPKQP